MSSADSISGIWRNVVEAFEAIAELPAAERLAALDRLCGHDRELRTEVESLLAADGRADGFLEGPAIAELAQDSAASGQEAASERAPRLWPDEVLSGRYRVDRLLAQGGMGEVYEVEDLELGERVALKTLRPEIADDAQAIERFKREIQLARRLTHSSICRTFDLGRHRRATSPGSSAAEPDVTFLTMELLRGETLAARLRTSGPMTPLLALPLVRQICNALIAAHAAGIVHRDLKPGNIMLIPQSDGERVVVTDLGLARAASATEEPASGIGELAGTPAYMSPEQMLGDEASVRSDIYSLGVVLYRMTTGRMPFEHPSPLVGAVRRLSGPPASPRTLVPALDRRWEAVILRCLAGEPADRYTSVSEVIEALDATGANVRPRRPRRLVRFAAVVALIAGVGVASYVARETPVPGAHAPRRSAVAIWELRNTSGRPETAWVSTALAEMLTTELAAGETLRMIPGDRIARTRRELSTGSRDVITAATRERLRGSLAADVVVLGSYFALGDRGDDRIRLDVRVEDVGSGEILGVWAGSGTQADIGDLAAQVGAELRRRLGVAPSSGPAAARGGMPHTPAAARLYAEGLAALRLFDALSANEHLLRAAAADPDSPLIRAALARSWSALGYDARARDEARNALDRSESLPREARLVIEATYREMTQDWNAAVEIWRSLWTFFPDDVEYGLRLTAAQRGGGRAKEALATVEVLQRLPRPARDDPRIDLAEARAAESLADHEREWAAAERAAQLAIRQDARLLLAMARALQGNALSLKGELTAAEATYREAQAHYEASGDRLGALSTQNGIALILDDRGDTAGAKALYEQALPVLRATGYQRGLAGTLNNLAVALIDEGNLAEAQRLQEEALGAYRRMGAKNHEARTLGNMALVVMRQGDLSVARELYRTSIAILRETGERSGLAMALSNMGEVLRMQSTTPDEFAHVRKTLEEALAIRREIGEKGKAALTRLALADLSIEEGRATDVEATTRELAAAFASEQQINEQAYAFGVLAKALRARGELERARDAVERATTLSTESGRAETRIGVAIVAAHVRASSGAAADVAAALSMLEVALSDAQRIGHVPLALEARLALGELETGAPSRQAAGRVRLEILERDAAARSFSAIAKKAAAARRVELR